MKIFLIVTIALTILACSTAQKKKRAESQLGKKVECEAKRQFTVTLDTKSYLKKCALTRQARKKGEDTKKIKSLLHRASYEGKKDQVLKLVGSKESKVNINERYGECGWTPLHYASQAGQAEVVSILLKHGAEVNKENFYKNTPLHHASLLGHLKTASALLSHGAVMNSKNLSDGTPLGYAVYSINPKIIALFLENGLDPKGLGDERFLYNLPIKTWLRIKMDEKEREEKKKKIVKIFSLLLEKGLDPNNFRPEILEGKTYGGDTYWNSAITGGNTKLVELLIRYGVNVNDVRDTYSPLTSASMDGHVGLMKVLLKHGADVDLLNQDGTTTALYMAALSEQMKAVSTLLEHGARVNFPKGANSPLYGAITSPLHGAVVSSLYETVTGSPYEAVTGSPYGIVTSSSGEIVRLLIQKGANINEKTSRGDTPLHDAMLFSHLEAADTLLKNEAQVNIQNNSGDTPLHFSTLEGFTKGASSLLKYGADINIRNNKGWTPLQVAASLQKNEVASLLIEKGADVNLTDQKGWSALDKAICQKDQKMVSLLVKHGAKAPIKNKNLAELLESRDKSKRSTSSASTKSENSKDKEASKNKDSSKKECPVYKKLFWRF